MRLYKRGDTWWTSVYSADGRRVRVSTHCRDKTAAESVARRIERDASDPDHAATHAETLGDTLARLIRTRVEQVSAGRRSSSTVTFYRSKAGHWTRVVGADFRMARFTAAAVDGFISQRRSEGAADTTIHKELVTMRAALKLAIRAGVWDGRVERVLPVAFSPAYVPRTRALTPEELMALMRQLSQDDAARVAFIVATSARWAETCAAQRQDVSLAGRVVLLRGTKTDDAWREVPLVRDWQRTLADFVVRAAEGRDGALFHPQTSIRWALRRACASVGIPVCSPNDLRRTCATWMRRDGASTGLIAAVLGHADTRMVERVYGRLDTQTLRMRLENDCDTGVSDTLPSVAHMALMAGSKSLESLPGDGIEPPTRGFSILSRKRKTG